MRRTRKKRTRRKNADQARQSMHARGPKERKKGSLAGTRKKGTFKKNPPPRIQSAPEHQKKKKRDVQFSMNEGQRGGGRCNKYTNTPPPPPSE